MNLEPRFSPDGTRLAFVSTLHTGHFHIFAAQFRLGKLTDIQQLTAENVSTLPRYYYSQVDHEISPVWSRDGSDIAGATSNSYTASFAGTYTCRVTASNQAAKPSASTSWL